MIAAGAVTWHDGAPPEAMVDAFAEAALTVAILAALLDDPMLRARAIEALQRPPAPPV